MGKIDKAHLGEQVTAFGEHILEHRKNRRSASVSKGTDT